GVAGSALDPVARLPALFPPIPVSLVDFIVVWAWHTPALHHAARQSGFASLAEQGMFFLAGLWLWLAVFSGTGDERRGRAGSGVLALLLTSMHMTLLGALLALAPRPLFAHATADGTHVLDSLAALADQQLGGAIMLLVGGVAYLAGGLWLTAGLLRRVDYRQRART
ncbi:MAG: cytochrome c oxidase assembly protein, partial [Candidatus Binatia bacterium]